MNIGRRRAGGDFFKCETLPVFYRIPCASGRRAGKMNRVLPVRTGIVELEGIGHFPHLEAPAAVLKELPAFHARI